MKPFTPISALIRALVEGQMVSQALFLDVEFGHVRIDLPGTQDWDVVSGTSLRH
jgi:hypothetical protein